MKLIPLLPLCIEPFTDYPSLGRFAVLELWQTVAVGVVKSVQQADISEYIVPPQRQDPVPEQNARARIKTVEKTKSVEDVKPSEIPTHNERNTRVRVETVEEMEKTKVDKRRQLEHQNTRTQIETVEDIKTPEIPTHNERTPRARVEDVEDRKVDQQNQLDESNAPAQIAIVEDVKTLENPKHDEQSQLETARAPKEPEERTRQIQMEPGPGQSGPMESSRFTGIPAADFEWICGQQADIVHRRLIAYGGSGEVHEVHEHFMIIR